MANQKIQDMLLGATKVAYKSKFEYCQKVVRSLLSLAPERASLVDKEVEILCVMCKMCLDGNESAIMKGNSVLKEMEELGLSLVTVNTLRNYRYNMRRRGWLEGDKLNMRLRKAISDGGFCTGIFFDRKNCIP